MNDPGIAQAHSSITLAKKEKKNLFATAKGKDGSHSNPLAPGMLEHPVGSSTMSIVVENHMKIQISEEASVILRLPKDDDLTMQLQRCIYLHISLET